MNMVQGFPQSTADDLPDRPYAAVAQMAAIGLLVKVVAGVLKRHSFQDADHLSNRDRLGRLRQSKAAACPPDAPDQARATQPHQDLLCIMLRDMFHLGYPGNGQSSLLRLARQPPEAS